MYKRPFILFICMLSQRKRSNSGIGGAWCTGVIALTASLLLCSPAIFGQVGAVSDVQATTVRANLRYPLNRLAEKLGRGMDAPGKQGYRRQYVLAAPGKANTVVTVERTASDAFVMGLPDGSTISKAGREETPQASKGSMSSFEEELLAALFLDEAHEFISLVQNGAPVRIDGLGYRPEGSAVEENYAGPLYDVLSLLEVPAKTKEATLRRYLLDARTGLLARVTSLRGSDATQLSMTTYSDWHDTGAAWLPRSIRRFGPAGKLVFELSFSQ